MCLMVYIAANAPLDLIPRDDKNPGFHVKAAKPLPTVFTARHVYYAGSDQGCGCGFLLDGAPQETPERAQVENNYRQFSEYLDSQLQNAKEIDVYACWAGSESSYPTDRKNADPKDLLAPNFEFKELELLHFETQKQDSRA